MGCSTSPHLHVYPFLKKKINIQNKVQGEVSSRSFASYFPIHRVTSTYLPIHRDKPPPALSIGDQSNTYTVSVTPNKTTRKNHSLSRAPEITSRKKKKGQVRLPKRRKLSENNGLSLILALFGFKLYRTIRVHLCILI
jgi:hypothetical protein